MRQIIDINSCVGVCVCVCVCVCLFVWVCVYGIDGPTQILSTMKKINSQQLFNLLTFAQTGPNLTCMCTTGSIDSWNAETLMWGYLLGAQNSVCSSCCPCR
jgi:hypothetical protein